MKPDTSTVDPVDLNLARRHTVGDALTRAAEKHPQQIAVVEGERRISYAQLDHDAEAMARGIINLPDAPEQGEPVAIMVANSADFLAIYFGIAKSARVALPINYALTPSDIAWILDDAGVRTVIIDDAMLPLLEATIAEGVTIDNVVVRETGTGAVENEAALSMATNYARVDLTDLLATPVDDELRLIISSDDIVQCLYTSGTTARPKGALATHSAVVTGVMSNAVLIGKDWGEHPGTMLLCLPLFHVTGLNTLAKPVLFLGGTLVLQQGFDPATVLDAIEREKVTVFTGLPMMWAALIAENQRQARDLSSMETAMYAMAQMPERILAGMDAMMPNARKVLGSGQTEVVPATTFQRTDHRHGKNESWGVPSPTVRTRIMAPDGRLLPPGEVGEIVYRGPHVTAGYWNRPDANQEAFRHGWFHSGDVGYMDDEGVVWFVDRVKDIIKTGGENVSSMKVERIVADAPGVIECTVIGTPDDHWGEAVTAVVCSDKVPAVSEVSAEQRQQIASEVEAEILSHVRDHLSGVETPKRVWFVEALPKTSTGKIRKNVLREEF
ncbi:AMP-binding protein [Auritidibacter sp. NML130574]|uniref:AMP-binding protein n=1 Tax=Auritidibacter sp. NML130574 TaxID=2170745 RepID=UPI00143D39A4|nr:AMP-binding protein [Auritidibacter sp. NML130574]